MKLALQARDQIRVCYRSLALPTKGLRCIASGDDMLDAGLWRARLTHFQPVGCDTNLISVSPLPIGMQSIHGRLRQFALLTPPCPSSVDGGANSVNRSAPRPSRPGSLSTSCCRTRY